MKTTVEIPDDLFRRAKAKAALEGTTLRELMTQGLEMVLEQPRRAPSRRRASFPLIRASGKAASLTNEMVAQVVEAIDEEEAQQHARFVRR
jgi:hypothetical protein